MAHARVLRHEPPHGVVRPRGSTCRRGDHDPGAVPVATVTLFGAADCSLCDRAREALLAVRAELGFELEIVDIAGDPVLEERYRELLPVVEIDGERAFTYFVDADALRAKLGAG
ncbi:MAG TPA: glutaredoxin family protein [Gaiellaceae bacterium]|nr:glutaredoxin family protein [Gaiellaceae bacterium]